MQTSVKVTGLRELQAALVAFDTNLKKDLQAISLEAAEKVAKTTRQQAPRRSGTLAGSVKARATSTKASVVVGPLVYAKPIIFGWPHHNITANPFPYAALDQERDAVVDLYGKRVTDLAVFVFGAEAVH